MFLLSFQAFPEFAKIRQCGVSSVECIYNMSIIISTPELPESLVTSHINETCDCLANCQETVRQFIDNYYIELKWFTLFQFLWNCIWTGVRCACNFYESRTIATKSAEKCHNWRIVSNFSVFIAKRTTRKNWRFLNFSDMPARDMVKLTSVKVTYEDINCIKYRRIVYMSWDNMLGLHYISFIGAFGGRIV